MPLVRSIDVLPDGISIVTSRGPTYTITSADIPANVINKPIATVEAWVNDWLAQRFTPVDEFALVKIESLSPLVMKAVVSSVPLPSDYFDRIARP